ncbi:Tight junction associated protein 1 (Peripheral) [Nesidiocoris tenuis]|uniref:Tight junction associated protein 1 (Peripheral) n=1 Tax=Nesidiocoris tenuis TaxID=355587 RepID=A0ABN7ACU7_9HEMI|nr:Tight junction associated protein 1 (Peripheral) [Nesidiocoris tenuis]
MMSGKKPNCHSCGCRCDYSDQAGLHLHVEIENLKQQLLEKENHILSMETNFLKEADKFPNGEMAAISEELLTWQDKYSRLYEAHKRVQKVNQNLEDKLLRIVDKCEMEKNALTAEVANLTRRLVDEKFSVTRLQEENERYRNDVNLAIQLLQCKPSNFVPQKYDSLPSDMQQKVRMYVSSKRRQSDGNGNVHPKPEMKTIKVPIPTYPPTAMVYSINKGTVEKDPNTEEKSNQPVDIVSAAIMAKILEEREKERALSKHCDTCCCSRQKSTKGTQTYMDPFPAEKHPPPAPNTARNYGKLGTSIMAVRNRLNDKEKEKPNHVEISIEMNPTVEKPKSISFQGSWEPEPESSSLFKIKKPPSNQSVAEGILVNIDSVENSSINSATSDSSSLSWQSKTQSTVSPAGANSTSSKHEDETADLISFDKPAHAPSKDGVDASHHRVSGPRHCSVRMQIGSNNILLDNVVDPFTPVLYKSKTSDALVHSSRSRSGSSNSSCDEPVGSTKKATFRTETEI